MIRQMDATYPPALLGFAAASLRCAQSHAAQGMHGRAAAELAAAAAAATTCARLQPALAAAWKLRGDILAMHVNVPVAPDEAEGEGVQAEGGGNDTAQATMEALRTRGVRQVAAVTAARAAYARVVHLTPWAAPATVDLAAAVVGVASLQRAAPAECQHEASSSSTHCASTRVGRTAAAASTAAAAATETHATAERVATGAVRLAPDSPTTWAALGAAATAAERRENALARCLQLQRQNAPAWAALGRLYLHKGSPGAAAVALEQARASEPTSAAAWTGTAALHRAEGRRQLAHEALAMVRGKRKALPLVVLVDEGGAVSSCSPLRLRGSVGVGG